VKMLPVEQYQSLLSGKILQNVRVLSEDTRVDHCNIDSDTLDYFNVPSLLLRCGGYIQYQPVEIHFSIQPAEALQAWISRDARAIFSSSLFRSSGLASSISRCDCQ
jgi:hypothetical protein